MFVYQGFIHSCLSQKHSKICSAFFVVPFPPQSWQTRGKVSRNFIRNKWNHTKIKTISVILMVSWIFFLLLFHILYDMNQTPTEPVDQCFHFFFYQWHVFNVINILWQPWKNVTLNSFILNLGLFSWTLCFVSLFFNFIALYCHLMEYLIVLPVILAQNINNYLR